MRRLALFTLAFALLACDTGNGGTTVCIGESCGKGGGFVPADDSTVDYGSDAVDGGSAFGSKDGGTAPDSDGAAGDDIAGDALVDAGTVDAGGDDAALQDGGPGDAGAEDTGAEDVGGPTVLDKCSQIIACTSSCGPADALCHTACDAKATGEAKQALSDYEGCSASKCEPLQNAEYANCMLDKCLDQTAACWTGGSATCAATVDCSIACLASVFPEICLQDCAAATSAEEFKHFAAYTKCLDTTCKTEGALCNAAATFICHGEADQCGMYQGGGDCSEAVDCLAKCLSADCIIACQKGTKSGDGQTAGKLLKCMVDTCGESGTSQCAQDAAQGACKSQSFACFF